MTLFRRRHQRFSLAAAIDIIYGARRQASLMFLSRAAPCAAQKSRHKDVARRAMIELRRCRQQQAQIVYSDAPRQCVRAARCATLCHAMPMPLAISRA